MVAIRNFANDPKKAFSINDTYRAVEGRFNSWYTYFVEHKTRDSRDNLVYTSVSRKRQRSDWVWRSCRRQLWLDIRETSWSVSMTVAVMAAVWEGE